MKKLIMLFVILPLVFSSCSNSNSKTNIPVINVTEPISNQQFFSESVKDINLIPLQTREDIYILNNRSLIKHNNEFYIANADNGAPDFTGGEKNTILRFSADGNFINKISNNSISNHFKSFNINNGFIYVCQALPFSVHKFSIEGDLLNTYRTNSESEYHSGFYFNDNIIFNLNPHFSNSKYVINVCDTLFNDINKGLYYDYKFSLGTGAFSPYYYYRDTLLFCSTFRDTIYNILPSGNILPRLYVKFSDEEIENKEKSIRMYNDFSDWDKFYAGRNSWINTYQESDDYSVIYIGSNLPSLKGEKLVSFNRIGLVKKLSGIAQFTDFYVDNLFFKRIQYLDGDKLYFLLPAKGLKEKIPEWLLDFISNKDLLSNISDTSNDIIFQLNLK